MHEGKACTDRERIGQYVSFLLQDARRERGNTANENGGGRQPIVPIPNDIYIGMRSTYMYAREEKAIFSVNKTVNILRLRCVTIDGLIIFVIAL